MTPLPTTFEEALEALEADTVLTEAMGPELVRIFRVIKEAELERARRTVTDWEFRSTRTTSNGGTGVTPV